MQVKFILPTAPYRPVSINGGRETTGWYDLYTLTNIDRDEDSIGIHESFKTIDRLIKIEVDKGLDVVVGDILRDFCRLREAKLDHVRWIQPGCCYYNLYVDYHKTQTSGSNR